MKTLGLVYSRLGRGGIERGASFQIPFFRKLGWKVVVFTSFPPSDSDYAVDADFEHVCIGCESGAERERIVEREVKNRKIGLVVHHDAYSLEMFLADLRGTRAGGAKFVVFWYSVFSHFLLRSGRCRETVAFWDACRLADAAITLTRVDETFFRMYGVPAAAIAYCDPDMMADFVRCSHPKLILWMGRFVELKRPLDALKIFERVQERHPDAELVVLGDGDCAISLELRRYLSSRPALAAAVRLEGFKSDVRPYLEKAGVGLVTSRFEGYGHSIVEMKMASLPVVAYEMPWLDTLQPHSGALTVPQGDIDAAADAISGLFDDAESCRAQGERARRSYSEITATDQVSAYSEFFDAVGCGDVSGFSVPRSEYVRNVMETLSMHIDAGLAVHESDIRSERDEFWRRNRNYRAGRIVSWPYRIVKRLFAHWWNDGK